MNSQEPLSPLNLQAKLSKLKQHLRSNTITHEQALNINQSLRPALTQVSTNLQTKIKPTHDKLANQRKSLYQLLNYDHKLTLKDNYLIFYHQSTSKNNNLTKTLSWIQKRQKQLKHNSANLHIQLQQTQNVKTILMDDKIRMERHILDLEHQKFNKLSLKSTLAQSLPSINPANEQIDEPSELDSYEYQSNSEHQSNYENDNNSEHDNNSEKDNTSSINDSISINSHSQSIANIQSSVQSPKHTRNKSFHFHPATFANADQIFDRLQPINNPKSKQILNSLEKQLNPLKLNQVIALLEQQAQNLKLNQIQKLLQLKQQQLAIKKSLKDKQNLNNHKLNKIQTHINNFKKSKFPNLP